MRKTLAALLAGAVSAAALASDAPGANVYLKKGMCVSCHGKDGSGDTPAGRGLKAADLRTERVQSRSDDELQAAVANGRGKMPSFKSSLTAADIRDVIAYVRTLRK